MTGIHPKPTVPSLLTNGKYALTEPVVHDLQIDLRLPAPFCPSQTASEGRLCSKLTVHTWQPVLTRSAIGHDIPGFAGNVSDAALNSHSY